MDRVGVMQVIDSLDAGGAERTAVNLANLIPRDRYRSYLCSTRCEGVLEPLILPDVGRLRLGRTSRWDFKPLRRLVDFIRENHIGILHAHTASLYTAVRASLFRPHPAVIWHDHYGLQDVEERPGAWAYRLLLMRADAVIAVNETLADWSRRRVRPERVHYIPTFGCLTPPGKHPPDLPGTPGSRIVCMAMLRPQKDHLTLIRAMRRVAERVPEAHLLLVGGSHDEPHRQALLEEIEQLGLGRQVSVLGQRLDVGGVLRSCDVGVLSSISEGLPQSLIEYGLYGLAAVATSVGQCPEVLRQGEAGLLVPPSSPDALAAAILELLESPERRATLAGRLQSWVRQEYGADAIVGRVCELYDQQLAPRLPRLFSERVPI